jgi:hypothetical protein
MVFIMEIVMTDFSKKITYTGHQIHPLWALDKHAVAGDSIIIFRGPMKVPLDEMIDLQDIAREKDLADILISGDDCLHFIIELFDTQPASLRIAYHRLHLLCFIVKTILDEKHGIKLMKKGTDLYHNERKLNVGIATTSNNSMKIHFGLNIISTGVPSYVKAVGLHDLKPKMNLQTVATTIAHGFKEELEAIEKDIIKTKTFQ